MSSNVALSMAMLGIRDRGGSLPALVVVEYCTSSFTTAAGVGSSVSR